MRQNITIGCVKFTFLTLFFNFSFVIIGQGKYLNIQIPPVNKLYSSNECEPSIAINPFRLNEMAAGSILAGYHYSSDSGKTWQSKEIKSPCGVWGDPVVSYDSKGRLYYFHLANYTKTSWIDRIVCKTSDKIQGQFSTSIAIDQSNGDLHFVYYDRSRDNADENKTEVVWCRSEDGGITFKSEIISTSAFIPTKEIFFGDYLGIAVNKGVVRPIWPRMDKQKIILWTALINFK